MVLVKRAILITEICFHNCPICGLRPLAMRRNKFRAN
jgi:2-iminoacetate synthase ThiH